jgi:hypothetical protein
MILANRFTTHLNDLVSWLKTRLSNSDAPVTVPIYAVRAIQRLYETKESILFMKLGTLNAFYFINWP